MNDDAPKSALELAMARLKQKDAEAGSVEAPLTDAQKAEIADTRQIYAARRAQAEIMHKASLASAFDVDGLARLQEEFRRDTDRMQRELDEKVAAIRRRSE
ncbi:MAG: hypothetical protein IT181_06370 [Acidobacteria bacterium]|nr:hypothetical protein [Acidobacteriota bacterium]